MSGIAVVGVQREQEGAEHTALGGSCVEHYSGGGVTTSLNYLRSVCEEVQYQVAECGTQAQSAKFANQFDGGDCADCWAEINKQHSDVGVVIFKVCADWVDGSGDGILCGSAGSEYKLVRVQADWDVVFETVLTVATSNSQINN